MPRKPEIDRPVKLTTTLPESVMGRLALYLHSDLEQRIPKGAYQAFFLARIREFFDHERLDLGPYTGASPGLCIISGSPLAIKLLKEKLEHDA